uniref:Uncharacterized protein n=1 Tax=Arundo donax TaxID=35708 RepID=A0A0A8Z8H0_ARUDO
MFIAGGVTARARCLLPMLLGSMCSSGLKLLSCRI